MHPQEGMVLVKLYYYINEKSSNNPDLKPVRFLKTCQVG
jgi:hypothetical protein